MLRVGESGVAPADLDRLLEGVYIQLAPVIVDAGADYVAAADAVLALVAGLESGKRCGDVHRPGRRPVDRVNQRT